MKNIVKLTSAIVFKTNEAGNARVGNGFQNVTSN